MAPAKNRKSVKPSPAKNCKSIKPFSVDYACAKLGCSLPRVYALIRAGKLRSYKIGSKGRRVSDQAILDCVALLESEQTVIAPQPCRDKTKTATVEASTAGAPC